MRTVKTFLNFSSSVFNTFISMAIGLLATPYILNWLGKDSYGAYRALTDLTSYFSLFEFGFFGVLLMKFAEFSKPEKSLNSHQIFSYGFKYYIKLSIFALLAAFILYPFLTKFVPVQLSSLHDLNYGYLIMIISLIFFPFQTFKAHNEANQKSYVNNKGILLQTTLTIALSLIFAKIGWGIKGQALAFLIGLLISNIFVAAKTGISLFATLKRKTENETIKNFHILRWSTFILDLCGRAAVLSDNIIISIMLGPSHVPMFHLTQRLINIIQTQLQNISQASWSSLSDLYHGNQIETYKARVYDLSKFISITSMGILIGLVIFNERLITIWVGNQFYGGQLLTTLTIINAFCLALFSLWGWCFTGVSKNYLLIPMMITQAIINIVISFVATKNYGIIGPALGSTVAYFLIPSIWIPILLKKHFQISIRTLFFKVISPIFLGLFILIPLYLKRAAFLDWHWYSCLVGISIIFVVYLVLSYFILLDLNEKNIYKQRIIILINAFTKR